METISSHICTFHMAESTRITFNRVERGRAELGITEIELLAQEFGLPFSFFLQQSNMEEQV